MAEQLHSRCLACVLSCAEKQMLCQSRQHDRVILVCSKVLHILFTSIVPDLVVRASEIMMEACLWEAIDFQIAIDVLQATSELWQMHTSGLTSGHGPISGAANRTVLGLSVQIVAIIHMNCNS